MKAIFYPSLTGNFFGEAHLYQKSPIDPEGFVSTLSAIAHTCIGFSCGKWIIQSHQTENKVLRLFLTGFILMSIGYLLADALPLNKEYGLLLLFW